MLYRKHAHDDDLVRLTVRYTMVRVSMSTVLEYTVNQIRSMWICCEVY